MTMNIPFQTQQPIFTKVGGIAELIHMSAEERSRYNISLDSYRTNLSAMKNERAEGIEEGIAKGIAKGRAEGRAEGIRSTAIKLKSMGMDIAFISQATGLSETEINAL